MSRVQTPVTLSPPLYQASNVQGQALTQVSGFEAEPRSPLPEISAGSVSPQAIPRSSVGTLPVVAPVAVVEAPTGLPVEVVETEQVVSEQPGAVGQALQSMAENFAKSLNLLSEKLEAGVTAPLNPLPEIGEGLEVPGYEGVLEKSIEKKIIEKGFIPLEKIIVPEGGVPKGRYIKIINEHGMVAFVELDLDGYLVTKAEDKQMFESKMLSSIPYSAQIGAFKTCGMDTHGIAFENEGEICTLTKERGCAEPKVCVLTSGGYRGEKSAMPGGMPMACPIVKFSELMQNPKLVCELIKKVKERLRKCAHEACAIERKETKESIHKLKEAYECFCRQEVGTDKKIEKTLSELHKYKEGYLKQCNLCDGDKVKLRRVLHNIKRRYELEAELLRICEMTSVFRSHIVGMTAKLNEVTGFIKKLDCELDFIM